MPSLLPEWRNVPLQQLRPQARIPFEVVPDNAILPHFADAVFEEFRAAHERRQPLGFILPVGPRKQYPLLADKLNASGLSLDGIHLFFMDEYLDWEGRLLPADNPVSFRGYMQDACFSRLEPRLGLRPERICFPDPEHLDEPERRMRELGGVEVCFGGVGVHGHVAFNEPPLSRYWQVPDDAFRRSRTRIVPLAPETITLNAARANGCHFAEFPFLAVSLGMGSILGARKIRLYCDGGAWQRTAMRMALLGPVGQAYPVTFLQEHPDARLIISESSAAPLCAE